MKDMDLLKRDLAPILPEAWELIDREATRVLKLNLAGRKLVDVRGPHGWQFASVNTGRLQPLRESEPELVTAVCRLCSSPAPLRCSRCSHCCSCRPTRSPPR